MHDFFMIKKVPNEYKAHQPYVTLNIILVNNKKYSAHAMAQLLFKRVTNETYQKGIAQSILIPMKGRHTEKHDGASDSWKSNPFTSSCP